MEKVVAILVFQKILLHVKREVKLNKTGNTDNTMSRNFKCTIVRTNKAYDNNLEVI